MNFSLRRFLFQFIREFIELHLNLKKKTTTPTKLPIISAQKSYILPLLPTNIVICKISVRAPYADAIKKDNRQKPNKYLLLFSIFRLYPHKIKKDKKANINICAILSGPSHSQKLITVGKKFPGSPISSIIINAHKRLG